MAEDFLLIGRTLEEYRHMFALEPAEVVRPTILDCAAGPSSFAAEATTLGADVTGVDPAYARPLADLQAECVSAVDRTAEQLAEKRDRFEWGFYGDVDTRIRLLRAASERFIADAARSPGRYVAGALPSLPFERDAFDLVLCAHFLFLYDDRLSRPFHVAAARELARVAANGVRLFPLVALNFERSGCVDDVVAALRADGLSAEVEPVPFEFQPGATAMLRVSDTEGYVGGT